MELVSGEIAEDLTNYYASSEQVPTVCALGVLVDKESGEAMLSGGLLIQALPGADNAALDRLEQNIAQLDSVTTMLAKGMGPEEMCRAALEGFEVEILNQAPVYYACNCSKERFARGLLTLGAKELLSPSRRREGAGRDSLPLLQQEVRLHQGGDCGAGKTGGQNRQKSFLKFFEKTC